MHADVLLRQVIRYSHLHTRYSHLFTRYCHLHTSSGTMAGLFYYNNLSNHLATGYKYIYRKIAPAVRLGRLAPLANKTFNVLCRNLKPWGNTLPLYFLAHNKLKKLWLLHTHSYCFLHNLTFILFYIVRECVQVYR